MNLTERERNIHDIGYYVGLRHGLTVAVFFNVVCWAISLLSLLD